MTDSPKPEFATALGISAVERDTGLSKDILRIWERRYGFPNPTRDQHGERLYPAEQVEKLRIIRRLMAAGHRPGRIIALSAEQLLELAAKSVDPALLAGSTDHLHGRLHGDYLQLLKAHQVGRLRHLLMRDALRLGIERFVTELIAPLNRIVGDSWASGQLEIFEEHLYSESVQMVLRSLVGSIPPFERRPYVLLTTFPQEPHGLGLLMVEAVLSLDGCRCVSLGVQTPIADIARTAVLQQADVVGLSFSPILTAGQVLDGLEGLRAQLPPEVEIWAGGHNPVLQRRPPARIRVMRDLSGLHEALAEWRAAHPEVAAEAL